MHIRNLFFMCATVLSLLFFHVSCGTNLYSVVVSKGSDEYALSQAAVHIDKAEYEEAEEYLSKVEASSNEKTLLQVGAKMGKSGMSIWKVVTDMLDNNTFSRATGSGFDRIYDLFSEAIYGEGETRTARLAALNSSVTLLEGAPEITSSTLNLSCFLSGLLVAPRVKDGTKAIADATLALNQIIATATGGGISQDNCPDLNQFQEPLNNVTTVQSDISLALAKVSNCSFLNYDQSGSQNVVQKTLQKFISSADKGCTSVSCNGNAACEALQLTCVKDLISDANSAQANDGKIAVCEILTNCRTVGSCF